MPFRDCVGHRRLLAVLARAVQRGSLPPSLVFSGADGVGKRHIAVALAQALNCLDPRSAGGLDLDACGVCSACKRIARGVHPDVLIVEPGDSGAIKVEQVREVIDRSGYRPFEGRRRVVIIDDADALVPQAQNALLKTLEEPPAGSVFVLVTARPDVLLPTVRSRCPQLRFSPLTVEEVVTLLVAGGQTAAGARAVAVTADGSIGRALESSAGDVLDSRDVATRVLGQVAAARDPKQRLDAAKDLVPKAGSSGAVDREQLARHLRAMGSLLRDVALLASGVDAAGLANADVRTDLERLAAFGGERGLRAFAAVDRALTSLDRNASSKIVADWVLLQL